MKSALTSLVIAIGLAGAVSAGPPSLRELQPWGGQRGQTISLTVAGDALAAGAEVFSAVPGRLEEQPGGTAGQLTFKLELRPDAAVGAYPIRLRTAGGLSNELLFSVGDLPEVAESEPNDAVASGPSLAAATAAPSTLPVLALPVTINGAATGTDQDVFHVVGKKGDRLVAEVEAQRIGSTLDPAIHLITADGRELATSDDTPGLGIDCRLDFTFAEDGDYFLVAHDAKYAAASPGHYRLKAGPLAYADSIFPLGWQRGSEVDVSLAGGTFTAPVSVRLRPAAPDGGSRSLVSPATGGLHALLPFRFALGDGPELLEPAAGDDRWFKDAAVLNGRIAAPAEVDRYKFPVQPGQAWEFAVEAASLGSRLDAILSVADAKGNSLGSADDSGELDPRVQIQVPAGIDHVVLAVEDLHRRGGPAFAYRLKARPVRPDFAIRIARPVVNIPRGGTAVVQVNAIRNGYNGPIQLSIPESLAGITAEDGLLAEGAASGLLVLSADAASPLRAFDLAVTGSGGTPTQPMSRPASTVGRSAYAMANSLAARVPAAVCEAPPVMLNIAERSLRVLHGHGRSLKVTAQRGPAATEAIAIKGEGLPGFVVSGAEGQIAKDASELTLNLQSNPEVPQVATFQLRLTGTTSVAGRQETIELPPVRVEVMRPFALEVLNRTLNMTAGSKVQIQAIVRREAPFEGAVKIGPAGSLPQHVSLATVDVPPGDSLGLLELAVADTAASAEFDIPIRASTNMEGRKRDKDYVIPDTIVRVRIVPKG